MKREREAAVMGIDFERVLRAAAKEMIVDGEERLRRKEIDDAERHRYETIHEIDAMVFEERRNPPMWRIETLRPGPNGMGVITARDPSPRFLEAELRLVLKGKFETYGVAQDSGEARKQACEAVITIRGTVPLRDSERFEGERGPR